MTHADAKITTKNIYLYEKTQIFEILYELI